jgi:hypothetical protein
MKPEDQLQINVINYINRQYPKALCFHVPNVGKRNVIEAAKFKRMGVLSGVPDILILNGNLYYSGLAIELKIKPNKPTKNQLEVMDKFKEAAFRVAVCYDFESTIKIIDEYFKNILV